MQKLISGLQKELSDLTKLEQNLSRRLEKAPIGSLHIYPRKDRTMYYQYIRDSEKRRKVYIQKQDMNLASALAQKQYDTDLLAAVTKQQKAIRHFLKHYDPEALFSVLEKLPVRKRALIAPEILDEDAYAKHWQNVSYSPGIYAPDTPVYKTLRGELVRSKTEKIIADTLYMMGIPYRYEYPVKLNSGNIFRPDFVILNKRTREEYILEHFGMMDDPEYCRSALNKLSIYMQNQIYPGEVLLMTFESRERPFSTNDLELLINHYLL